MVICVSTKKPLVDVSCFYFYRQQTDDVVHKKCSHGPEPLLGNHEQLTLLRIIIENPGILLSVIQREMFKMFGVQPHVSTICKTPRRKGCTQQKSNILHHNDQMNVELNLCLKLPSMNPECWCDRV